MNNDVKKGRLMLQPIKIITSKELEMLLEKEQTVSLIDVRENEEVIQGIIPGARHIRMGEIPARKEELDKNIIHFIICRSGARSGRVCEYLQSLGYDVVNVEGGMLDWEGEVKIMFTY